MIISIHTVKIFNQYPYPFMMETLNNLVIERDFFIMIKGSHKKPRANIILKNEYTKAFSVISGIRKISALDSPIKHCIRGRTQENQARKKK